MIHYTRPMIKYGAVSLVITAVTWHIAISYGIYSNVYIYKGCYDIYWCIIGRMKGHHFPSHILHEYFLMLKQVSK